MLNSEVHPYDLLRSERVIFSRPAMEKLQESLKKSLSRSPQKGGGVMATTYTVIRAADDYRKGSGREGNRKHAGVRSGGEGYEDRR